MASPGFLLSGFKTVAPCWIRKLSWWGGECYGICRIEARDPAKHPSMHRITFSPDKDLSGLHVGISENFFFFRILTVYRIYSGLMTLIYVVWHGWKPAHARAISLQCSWKHTFANQRGDCWSSLLSPDFSHYLARNSESLTAFLQTLKLCILDNCKKHFIRKTQNPKENDWTLNPFTHRPPQIYQSQPALSLAF